VVGASQREGAAMLLVHNVTPGWSCHKAPSPQEALEEMVAVGLRHRGEVEGKLPMLQEANRVSVD